jgi:hypothetical protein
MQERERQQVAIFLSAVAATMIAALFLVGQLAG